MMFFALNIVLIIQSYVPVLIAVMACFPTKL
jgi:hypothetical protein